MKNYYFLLLALFALVSCENGGERTLVVENSSAIDRVKEIIEVEINNPDDYVVIAPCGKAIQTQTTYNKKSLIFPATVPASSKVTYKLRKAERPEIDTLAIGKVYENRKNDLAWESDKIGYRVYSKIAGENGDLFYGYDVFTKRGKVPVLEHLYTIENDPHDRALALELRKTNPKASQTLYDAISYHIDHGQGMDYYVVGPTLGCGTAALLDNGNILYPGYYDSYEILDQGGLRFSFRIKFDPVKIGNDMVTEVRTITLDAGSHFNYIEVEYQGLTAPRDIVAGIVIHDEAESKSIGEGYMSYAEPVHIFGWQTYCSVIFPDDMKAGIEKFDTPKGIAQGHILAKGQYTPNTPFTYYMGAGWNRWGFTSADEWFDYVALQQQKLTKPLNYTLR
ncbi:MAG: DUF4861 family protein [Rikenellaceae bacterium]